MRSLCVKMSCLAEVRAAFLVIVVIIVLIIIAFIMIMTIMRTFRPKYSETENRTWWIKVLTPDQGMPQKERYNSADHDISLVVNTVLNFVFIPTSSVFVVSKNKNKRGNLTLYPLHDPDMLWDSPWAGGNTSVWASRLRILPPIDTKSV